MVESAGRLPQQFELVSSAGMLNGRPKIMEVLKLHLVWHGLLDQHPAPLCQVFSSIDEDGNGTLERHERHGSNTYRR